MLTTHLFFILICFKWYRVYLWRWRNEPNEQNSVDKWLLMMIMFISTSCVDTYCTVSVSSSLADGSDSSVLMFYLEAARVRWVAFCCAQVHSRCRVTSAGCKLHCSLMAVCQTTQLFWFINFLQQNKKKESGVNIQRAPVLVKLQYSECEMISRGMNAHGFDIFNENSLGLFITVNLYSYVWKYHI